MLGAGVFEVRCAGAGTVASGFPVSQAPPPGRHSTGPLQNLDMHRFRLHQVRGNAVQLETPTRRFNLAVFWITGGGPYDPNPP